MGDLVEHAKTVEGPVVICGDMNTVVPGTRSRWLVQLWHRFPSPNPKICGQFTNLNERYYFADVARRHGFEEAGDMSKNTWRMVITNSEAFDLKLDWMLYRGLKPISCKQGEYLGDHRSIIGRFDILSYVR